MSERKNNAIHEDWIVVILGALIILLSIAGIIIKVPVFSWENKNELIENVLSGGNLSLIFIQFSFV